MPKFNQFSYLPQVPYRIIEYLFTNENIWKILKYSTYDCLSKPNVSYEEKSKMLWKGQDNQEDFNIFLTPLIENMITQSKTIIKIFKVDSLPINHIISTVCYEFDILHGGKISLIEWEGMPCNRADVLEMELIQALNGAYVNGIGMLQFNSDLSKMCRSRANLSNDKTFVGTSIIMAVQVGDIKS